MAGVKKDIFSHFPFSSQAAPYFSLSSSLTPAKNVSITGPQPVDQGQTASLPGQGTVTAGHLAQRTQFCPLENTAITSLVTSRALVYISSSQTQSHWLRGSLWRAFVNCSHYWNPI